jgi:hypothetical protein
MSLCNATTLLNRQCTKKSKDGNKYCSIHQYKKIKIKKSRLNKYLKFSSIPICAVNNCNRYLIEDKKENLSTGKILSKYCSNHKYQYRLDKSDCCICFEKIEKDVPLQCGHWIHKNCLFQWIKSSKKDDCILCKTKIYLTLEEKKELFIKEIELSHPINHEQIYRKLEQTNSYLQILNYIKQLDRLNPYIIIE